MMKNVPKKADAPQDDVPDLESAVERSGARQTAPGSPLKWSISKLAQPEVCGAFANARLHRRLDAALAHHPVVWLHGPPGAGKTTLIARYVTDRAARPVWHRFDEDDADPSTFFFYVGMADAQARGTDQVRLPLLTQEYLPGSRTFSRRFFEKLFEGPDRRLVVFDDYQTVEENGPIHGLVAEGLTQIPAQANVIIISRSPPPKEFARLRINGLIDVIQPSLLRVTVEEALEIARGRTLAIDAETVRQLVGRTQGWMAGLVLMMEAGHRGDRVFAADEAVPEVLFDYFAEEIFRRMEPSIQRILMVASLLPVVTTHAANILTGQAGTDLLTYFARRDYFTVREGGDEPTYRFHPLFREFLLVKAREAFNGDQLSVLRHQAALALEASDQPEAAVILLHESQAWPDLARVILTRAAALVEKGRFKTLASWLDRLPEEIVAASGWLTFWAAMAATPFRPAQSRPIFRRALDLFETTRDTSGIFLAWAGLADAINHDAFANQDDLDGDIALLRELFLRYPTFPSLEIEVRVSVVMYIALGRRSNDRAEIARWRERASRTAAVLGRPGLLDMVLSYQVVYALTGGEFAEAMRTLEVLPAPDQLGDLPLLQEAVCFARAFAQVSRQMPGSCEETAETAIALSEQTGICLWTHVIASFAATSAFTRGDLAAGKLWLRRTAQLTFRRTGRKDAFHHGAPYHVAACNMAMLEGDVDAAVALGRTAVSVAVATGWLSYEALARLSLSQAYDDAGDVAAADRELTATAAATDRGAAGTLSFPIALLKADFLLERGHTEPGLAALKEAMALGERSQARRTCLAPHRASRLCAWALLESISTDYARLLIKTCELPAPACRVEEWPWPLRISTLGEFSLFRGGDSFVFSRKTPRRLLNLLKAIIAFGARSVPATKIIDAVWPDEDGDAGARAFDVAIHRLRKLVGDGQTIVMKEGRVSLDPKRCWLDVWEFEAGLASPERDRPDPCRLALYRGHFLEEDDDLPWAEPLRRQLKAKYLRAAEGQAKALDEAGDASGAAQTYRAAIEACPDTESLYQALMRHHLTLGETQFALDTYQQLRSALAADGLTPSNDSVAIHGCVVAKVAEAKLAAANDSLTVRPKTAPRPPPPRLAIDRR